MTARKFGKSLRNRTAYLSIFPVLCRWKRNIHKNALARGLPMVDSLGRVKPGRKTGPPCKCNRECFAMVNEVERRWILDNFNAIGDWSLQNVYLRGLIIAEPQMDGRSFKTFSYFAQTSQLSRTQVSLEFLQCNYCYNCTFWRKLT